MVEKSGHTYLLRILYKDAFPAWLEQMKDLNKFDDKAKLALALIAISLQKDPDNVAWF